MTYIRAALLVKIQLALSSIAIEFAIQYVDSSMCSLHQITLSLLRPFRFSLPLHGFDKGP